MSLSARPVRRLTSRSITRSQSFTGVNSYDRPYRNLSVFSTPGVTPGVSRKTSRASRMFTMSIKSNPPPKVPQPERVDQVYEALQKGLQSYLQIHQTDLDSLSRQMKESKRNSRLGFLYELDKQVKVTERFIRRLEFHLSKIEELYEAYCLQRRLRDGADKMVKAYTTSSVSKEAKESLVEANKGYKEYTENMCVMENDLENQLGEFHIKMKGLAGFARLCSGDQYEIFMRYGRQRWRLRGRIETNGKQVWDSEDMVFLPLINEFLSVKVTELKSLANHVVVGSVSCETKDLFAALPQSVAVDINDLGTIKLSLEVTWNPFDKDDQGSVSSSVNKAPTVSKRFSTIFNQSPPDTPSLREQAFYNMLRRHDELENGAAWSNSSESSDDSSSPQLSAGGPRSSTPQKPVIVSPEIQPASVTGSPISQTDISFCLRNTSSTFSKAQKSISEVSVPDQDQSRGCREEETAAGPDDETEPTEEEVNAVDQVDQVVTNSLNCRSFSRSLSHISEHSADDVVLTDRSAGESGEVMTSELSINGTEELLNRSPGMVGNTSCTTDQASTDLTPSPSSSPRTEGINSTQNHSAPHLNCTTVPQSEDETYVARLVSVEEEAAPGEAPGGGADGPVDCGLEEALGAVVSSLDDYRGQFPELQALEEELKLLQVTLKVTPQGGKHSRSPSLVSLTVETALGSFDFLNAADFEEDEEEKRSRNVRPLQNSATSLTTGCTTLDRCLVEHLKYCSRQLLRLGTFGPLRCGEMFALDRLLREARVLEVIRRLSKDNPRRLRQPADVVPQLSFCSGAVSLWHQCVGQDSVYSVSVDRLLRTLSTVYTSRLPEKTSSMADSVFMCLVERVLDRRLPRRGGSSRDVVMVTLFQLWSYVEANGVSDLETHVTELAEEVWFVQKLESCDQDVIVQTLRRPVQCSLKREGLHAVAKLLRDPRGKVSASASSVLRSVAAQPRQREQALVSCLELLEDSSLETRVCGCKALAPLKAKESIEQLVYLCQTDKEEVREAAKQTLLVLGEEGKMAHRHVETSMDCIPRLFAPGSMASTAF